MIINPYKLGSRGAKALRDKLRDRDVKCWTLQRAPKSMHALIVNWGSSGIDYPLEGKHVVNHPSQVALMSNKVKFFEATKGSDDTVVWTRDHDTALEWGTKVFARTKVEASGGEGIVVFDPETDSLETLPRAPLYTRYVPKTHEYRLHLARGLNHKGFTVMLVQRKVFVKTPERPAPLDWKVRSHANGFIFQAYPMVNVEMRVPAVVMEAAGRVMAGYFPDLHFAALDVMYHDKHRKAYVIEGNTAPGLENDTINVYADYLAALEKEHKSCLLR
jgi:hypothetical protein